MKANVNNCDDGLLMDVLKTSMAPSKKRHGFFSSNICHLKFKKNYNNSHIDIQKSKYIR